MDLIDRQQAIDALQKEINKAKPPFDDVVGSIRCGVRLARNIIEDLPSAQPYTAEEIKKMQELEFAQVEKAYELGVKSAQQEKQHGRIFQEIVVEYPSYNTYPEYKGKPYFLIKYTENGQEFIGYGTYKPEVLSEYLKEYFMPSAQPEQKWIPCSERCPKENGYYLTTTIYKQVYCDYWTDDRFDRTETVIAWMRLPDPYRGGDTK